MQQTKQRPLDKKALEAHWTLIDTCTLILTVLLLSYIIDSMWTSRLKEED